MTRRAASLLAAGLVIAALAACSDGGPDVRIEAVERRTVVEVVDAPATVTPRATATLTAAADGRVAELFVRDGQSVAGGALVARIDSPSAEQRLAQAREADAAAAANTVELPSADLSGVQAQLDAAAAASFATARAAAASIDDPARRRQAEQAVVAAERQYAAARAQSVAAVADLNAGVGELSTALSALTTAQRTQTRAAVALAEDTVARLELRAPISGVVTLGGATAAGESSGGLLDSLPDDVREQAESALGGAESDTTVDAVEIAVGVPVSSGTPIATITDVSALGLSAEVDETDVFLVKPGVGAHVELDAVPGATYTGRVTAVDVAASSSARGGVAYRVRLSLGAGRTSDGELAPVPRPGMSAVANLEVRRAANALSVPAAAVVRAGSDDAVWLVRNGKAHRQVVRLGAQGEDYSEVRSGLGEGDRIVVRGADAVREGQDL